MEGDEDGWEREQGRERERMEVWREEVIVSLFWCFRWETLISLTVCDTFILIILLLNSVKIFIHYLNTSIDECKTLQINKYVKRKETNELFVSHHKTSFYFFQWDFHFSFYILLFNILHLLFNILLFKIKM